jgi:hypothetical protein
MRVLVCGGRDYRDHGAVWQALGAIHTRTPIDVLIEGGATGADRWCAKWANCQHGVDTLTYPANWNKDGRAAGPIRNQRMLDEGKPDLVVAFPGGRGTADMVRRAKAAGVEVREITSPAKDTDDGE